MAGVSFLLQLVESKMSKIIRLRFVCVAKGLNITEIRALELLDHMAKKESAVSSSCPLQAAAWRYGDEVLNL